MASLPRDNWPEIFHTLNSVRRLAMHHAPLLGSQSNLHALIRDVLAQSENLRSQVAAATTVAAVVDAAAVGIGSPTYSKRSVVVAVAVVVRGDRERGCGRFILR